MNCPHCGKHIPGALSASEMGKVGGRASGPRKARDPQKMRAAADVRWARVRAAKAASPPQA